MDRLLSALDVRTSNSLNLAELTASTPAGQNPDSADAQVISAAADCSSETLETEAANSGLKEIKATHE
jgi:hypothetical protein